MRARSGAPRPPRRACPRAANPAPEIRTPAPCSSCPSCVGDAHEPRALIVVVIERALPNYRPKSVVLGLDDFLAAIEPVGGDVVATMDLARGRIGRQRVGFERVVGTTHTAPRTGHS